MAIKAIIEMEVKVPAINVQGAQGIGDLEDPRGLEKPLSGASLKQGLKDSPGLPSGADSGRAVYGQAKYIHLS